MSNMTDQTALDAPSMTATEATLAEMWRDLLGLSTVDPGDDFFKAGGTSLAAIKLLQRVEKAFGPDVLSPDTLYGDPQLRSVAMAIDEATGSR
ncbi:MAG: phosphopantetheine-binding protein [Mycobacteriales bacterium]